MIPPNSRYIEQRLSEIKNRKGKNAFLETIMSDPTATILNEVNGHRTTLFQGNKGPKTGTWEQTKQMAFELNEAGFDVAFIPEIDYLVRNEIPYGNIVLINKYRKVRLITYKDIRNEGYLRKTKGFL